MVLHVYDRQNLKTAGEIDLYIKHPLMKQCEQLTFHVQSVHKQPILSKDACVLFDLIKVNEHNLYAVNASDKSRTIGLKPEMSSSNILDEYADLMEGFGELPGEVHLDIDPEI